jgi:hypothetical protein
MIIIMNICNNLSTQNQVKNRPSKLSLLNKKTNLFFGAGLNAKVTEQIAKCDVSEISRSLKKIGIDTDFNDNKVVAWCCSTVLGIFQNLNKKYKLNLKLPKNIYVEDFSKLNIDNPEFIGFCNWFPSTIVKNSNKIFSEETLFFNKNFKWENIDKYSDEMRRLNALSSDHFLAIFIHEFAHCAHNGYLNKKLQVNSLYSKMQKFINPTYTAKYKEKYSKELSKISTIATYNQFEAIAEDITEHITGSLDSLTIQPRYNPFESNHYIIKHRFDFFPKKKTISQILKKAWNGDKLV